MLGDAVGPAELSALASTLLALAAAYAAARGARLVSRGLRHGDDPAAGLWIVRGIRGGVAGVALGAVAAGLAFSQAWLLVFGLVFLAEELYETGVLALILRTGARASTTAKVGFS
ncbi:MAG: hypothetical protein ACREMB_27710 [Candidatus Rokuibacteriota bacterium]